MTDDSKHAEHHIIPLKYYMINATVIAILMFLTILFGRWDELSFAGGVNGINFWIALGIAIAKAGCIGAIFMGVKWNTPLVKIFATGTILWVLVFFGFVFSDYMSPEADLGTPYTRGENIATGEYPLPR